MQYYNNLPAETAKQAIFNDSPCFSVLKKELGDEKTKAFLVLILTDVITFFNVGKTMNQTQVVQVVNLLQKTYFYLKPSELKYCFERAKLGVYGKLFDRIDGAIIFDWVECYLQERLGVIIEQNEHKHEKFKTDAEPLNIAVKEILNKVVSEIKTPEVKEKIIIPYSREKTEQELIIQDIMIEFDDLHNKIVDGEKQKFRIVFYNEKPYTIEKFVEKRLEEMKLL